MHEMSLMESVREIVEGAARANGARRVTTVRLRIGALAAVEPEALRFCFDVVMQGSVAAGATLEIDSEPGEAWCWDCAATVVLLAEGAVCPTCGSHRLQVTGGTEMRVKDIDLATDLATELESPTCA
jgi:hydrogenase nickel incorporation protein HypA/HybF